MIGGEIFFKIGFQGLDIFNGAEKFFAKNCYFDRRIVTEHKKIQQV